MQNLLHPRYPSLGDVGEESIYNGDPFPKEAVAVTHRRSQGLLKPSSG